MCNLSVKLVSCRYTTSHKPDMNQTKIHDLHKGFFRDSLSDLTVAKDLLQAHLSPEISKRIQWDSLRLNNKSYTDEKPTQPRCDLVYTCKLDKDDDDLYILVEHQNTPDLLLPFRFLQYKVAILTEYLTQNKHKDRKIKLPIILSLCIYTGKETPYPYSLDTYDCFQDPALTREAGTLEPFLPLT